MNLAADFVGDAGFLEFGGKWSQIGNSDQGKNCQGKGRTGSWRVAGCDWLRSALKLSAKYFNGRHVD